MDAVFQRCIHPAATCAVEDTSFACPRCGDLLDVVYDWELPPPSRCRLRGQVGRPARPAQLLSGVWRFRELLPFAPPEQVVTIGEGQTLLQRADKVGQYVGMNAGPAVPAVRGDEPLGQLQGQRHDGRVHARPHGRRQPGRLRQHRQHQRRRWPSTARRPG